jgi:hypothetical protein
VVKHSVVEPEELDNNCKVEHTHAVIKGRLHVHNPRSKTENHHLLHQLAAMKESGKGKGKKQ